MNDLEHFHLTQTSHIQKAGENKEKPTTPIDQTITNLIQFQKPEWKKLKIKTF